MHFCKNRSNLFRSFFCENILVYPAIHALQAELNLALFVGQYQ